MRIQSLDTAIANQIAAGEVIERPASVIKELLENSIDAGATVIEIDVEKAGQQLIRIRDNGHGIHPDDLHLSIHPHATSKLRHINDLNQLSTLGFRGEALASISSIAELSIQSQYHQHSESFQLMANGDVIAAAHPTGTTIEVRDLFLKVPVRRKFLKSDRTEFSHIEDLVKRLALSTYSVALSLKHNGDSVLRVLPALEPAQYLKRVSKVVGKKFAQSAMSIDVENHGLRLWGWFSPLDYTRAHADQQYLFINQRMVKDKVLQHALRLAYEGVYQQGQYPAYVLYFECEPETVDVNVHPTKHEVRFHQQRLVHDFVLSSMRKALHVTTQSNEPGMVTSAAIYTTQEPQQPYQHKVKQTVTNSWNALGLIAEQYLLATDQTQLLVCDYLQTERAYNQHLLATKAVTSQRLLMPVTLTLAADVVEKLTDLQATLKDYGVEISIVGDTAILIRQLPNFLKGTNYEVWFTAIAEQAEAEWPECLSRFSSCETALNKDQLQQRLHCFLEHNLLNEKTGTRYLNKDDFAELLA